MYYGMPMVTYGLFAYNTMQFHAVFLLKKLDFFHIKILAKFWLSLTPLVRRHLANCLLRPSVHTSGVDCPRVSTWVLITNLFTREEVSVVRNLPA